MLKMILSDLFDLTIKKNGLMVGTSLLHALSPTEQRSRDWLGFGVLLKDT